MAPPHLKTFVCVCGVVYAILVLSLCSASEFSLDWLFVRTGCVVGARESGVMEVLNGSRRSLKKRNKIHPPGTVSSSPSSPATTTKSLSSTYRSFRDSDVSLFQLQQTDSALSQKSLTLIDIPGWARRENSFSSIDTIHRSKSSALSTTDREQQHQLGRSEIAESRPLSCCSAPAPPNAWPLVHRCLRTLSHGHWFHHWRKISTFYFENKCRVSLF